MSKKIAGQPGYSKKKIKVSRGGKTFERSQWMKDSPVGGETSEAMLASFRDAAGSEDAVQITAADMFDSYADVEDVFVGAIKRWKDGPVGGRDKYLFVVLQNYVYDEDRIEYASMSPKEKLTALAASAGLWDVPSDSRTKETLEGTLAGLAELHCSYPKVHNVPSSDAYRGDDGEFHRFDTSFRQEIIGDGVVSYKPKDSFGPVWTQIEVDGKWKSFVEPH